MPDAIKRKRIVREREACDRLGCKRTKLRTDYRLTDPAEPFVPDTKIPRLRAIPLGLRNYGFLESEIDDLIDALAGLRAKPPGTSSVTHVFFADSATPRKIENRRMLLLDRQRRLRARLSGDADPDPKSEISEVEQALRKLDDDRT
jgi:predicted DNA-binding transcriptional regulator AlpA